MSTITLEYTVNGSPTTADSVVLSSSDGTYGIKNTVTGAVVVADGTAVTLVSVGNYSYTTTPLVAGDYEASWEVTYGAITEYFVQTFSIDATAATVDGVTLADIERELALRVGPYHRETVASGTTGGMVITAFKSSLTALGDVEDLYILRRGFKVDGSAVANFTSADRIRLVDSVDYGTGTVTPDRVWATAPVADEDVEFHYLHPTNELRRAVLRGLKRAYLYDRVTITFSSAAVERNLTDQASWIVDQAQVVDVQMQYTGATHLPYETGWWKAFRKSGDVWVGAARDPYPNPMLVTALRPAFTYVNGATNLAGPDDDSDVLAIDVAYAAAAAHVEAWRMFKPRLTPAANEGLGIPQKEAAAEFTRLAAKFCPPIPRGIKHSAPLGWVGPELP